MSQAPPSDSSSPSNPSLSSPSLGSNSNASLEAVLNRIKALANQSSAPVSPSFPELRKSSGSHSNIEEFARSAGKSAPKMDTNEEDAEFFRRTGDPNEPIIPIEPKSLRQAGLPEPVIEEMVTRLLLSRGEMTGRTIADHLKLPFRMIEPCLTRLKAQQLTVYSGATAMNDYVHVLTDAGRDRARRHMLKTTYFGTAPVSLEQYMRAVRLQSIDSQQPSRDDLRRAFSDLLINDELLTRLGPAINSGRGMFLYGFPGNGKTSIAERITRSYGHYIWIPRAILVDGEMMRLFDPLNHEECPSRPEEGLLVEDNIDHRWVRIRRPTIVAGGELTMSMLEIARNPETNISEAPLQLKSNCGVLLIDDFGRQRCSVQELLNRWMIPLERRHDYLSMNSGKKMCVPFDQLVVFSTNLQPRDLVDDAFLRRIPYKIEVNNPSEEQFVQLFQVMAKTLSIPYKQEWVDYLIATYYKPTGLHYRNCHPRDLLMQIQSYCMYNGIPRQMTQETIDFAVQNYFSVMG